MGVKEGRMLIFIMDAAAVITATIFLIMALAPLVEDQFNDSNSMKGR